MDAVELKSVLLCSGIDPGEIQELEGRNGGAGPAGVSVRIDNFLVNTVIDRTSPVKLIESDGLHVSFKDETYPFERIRTPSFYDRKTSCGTPMKRIALLHGEDCLATTLLQKCSYKALGVGCDFCAIETSYKEGYTTLHKSPQQLEEVLSAALNDGIKHMTITTGTPNFIDHGAQMLAETVEYLKKSAKINIHVQLTPPQPEHLDILFNSGADTVGLHIESFDKDVLSRICRGKSSLEYLKTLEYASDLFGEAQTSSFIIGGLGEKFEPTMDGFETLASIGVIPFLVPFRPLAGTKLQDRPRPDPPYMAGLFRNLGSILAKYGLDPKKNRAGCVRCGACSALDVLNGGR